MMTYKFNHQYVTVCSTGYLQVAYLWLMEASTSAA